MAEVCRPYMALLGALGLAAQLGERERPALGRALTGLGAPLDAADRWPETAVSDFHVGDRREPRASATAGVPLPTAARGRSLLRCARSGDAVLDGGRLTDRSEKGLGEMGTLSGIRSSGMSSPSSSSHSRSSWKADALAVGLPAAPPRLHE